MLKPWGEVTHGPHLRVDGIALAARWGRGWASSRMNNVPLRKVPNQSRSGPVGFVNEKAMRHQPAGMRTPRIDAETAFTPDPLHVLVQDKRQAEAGVEFLLPLR